MYKINIIDKISFVLVLLGAINWGSIGLFRLNIVSLVVSGSVLLQRLEKMRHAEKYKLIFT